MSSHHDPAAALEKSLRELDIEYVDVFMMHWPAAMTPDGKPMEYPGKPAYWETWKMMEKLVGEKCRGIAVSNFTQKLLERLLQDASVLPVVNEVELHALNPNLKLVPYCHDKGIQVVSWSTLGGQFPGRPSNPCLTNPLFIEMGKEHGVSAGVISLSWAVQRGIVVIPKSSNLGRIEENIRLVTLSEDEMERLNNAQTTVGKMRLSDDIEPMKFEMVPGKKTILGWTAVDFGWEDEEGNWLC